MTPGGIYADYAASSPYSRRGNNYESAGSYPRMLFYFIYLLL